MELKAETKFSITNLSRTEYEMIINALQTVSENVSGAGWSDSASVEYSNMAVRLRGML